MTAARLPGHWRLCPTGPPVGSPVSENPGSSVGFLVPHRLFPPHCLSYGCRVASRNAVLHRPTWSAFHGTYQLPRM